MIDVTNRAEVSRRSVVRGLVATAVMTTGLARVGHAFADAGTALTPFRYRAPASALEDLKRRLVQTRWPEPETVADWSQGVPINRMKALVEYWRTRYDWRRCEARLNGFAHYRTEIDGLQIHFLHIRSRHVNALPIIITHGWPGSVIEFFKVIEPLTDPTAHGGHAEDAFHVIAPSLPGFAFSDKPAERGWNAARIARAWSELMRRLGYTRYVAQGGDWGSIVTTTLAQQRPAGLAGIHLNMPFVFPDQIPTAGCPRPSSARSTRSDAFRPTGSDTSFSSRRARKRSAMRSRTRRWARPPGSTRSFMPGPTTMAIRNRPSRATRCSTTSRCTG